MNGLEYLAARAMARCAPLFRGQPALEKLIQEYDGLTDAQKMKLQLGISGGRFAVLSEGYCAGQPAADLALGLAVACALYPAAEKTLTRAAGEPLSLSLVWRLASGTQIWDEPDTARETLENLRLFLSVSRGKGEFRAPLTADERLVAYLAGGDEIDPLVAEVAKFTAGEKEEVLVRHSLLDELTRALDCSRQDGVLLHLSGAPGIGKNFAMDHAAAGLGLPLLAVDCRLLEANSLEVIWSMMDSIRREALFYGAVVCLRRADSFARRAQPVEETSEPWEKRFLHLCVEPLVKSDLSVCVCTDEPASFLPWTDRPVRQIEFPDCTRAEQIALWQGLAERAGVTLDPVQCGSKYKLSPRQIATAVRQLAHQDRNPTLAVVNQVCGRVLPPPDQGGIRRIRTSYTLEDLKLPAEQKQKLQNIADHVLYRHLVYDEWNMESRFAYGRNVSALFVGPPGTGKTMAVHVLSNMLDLPLYRIDLSQVVDKYIGETEKRLEKIFDTAEKSNVILFFDEADSIFGKRSEVNDAKDKYANTEVSYILQRIEQYDGIVILATNYKRNIDEAFMRRMRYLVEFQLPSPELREEIWQGSFAPQVPLQEIDFPYLARQFELSGGSIKNVALNAVFLAAESGGPVTMRHILESLRDENLKMGKPMLPQDFAEYAPLIRS